jgi:hypothetical protein
MSTQDLDCGEYQFFIAERGGLERYFQLEPVISYRWNRQRDAISEAFVNVSTESAACCQYMERMECGRHELVIERNGERVWEGPLTRLGFHRSYVEIEAHDVMHYAYRAIMKAAYNNAHPRIIYAVDRVVNILNGELARFESMTPPINVVSHIKKYPAVTGDAKTARSTKRYQRMVWEEIDEMAARGGIDYAVIGRTIMVFDSSVVIGRTKPLTEADFVDEIIVTQYGIELSTYSAVTDGEGHWGAWGKVGEDSFYGRWEILETQFDQNTSAKTAPTATVKEMSAQAKRNASYRYPSPVVVRVPDGAQLDPRSGLLLSDLVPGVRVPLTATLTCREVRQEQKLDKLQVEGSAEVETFRVTMSPAPGTAPWDDTETSGP